MAARTIVIRDVLFHDTQHMPLVQEHEVVERFSPKTQSKRCSRSIAGRP
jgi:hypothetical protein